MCLKKNAFSYVCWAIMSLVIVAFVLLLGSVVSDKYISSNSVAIIVLAVVFFGLLYGVYRFVGLMLKYSNTMNSEYINGKTSIVEELIIVGLLMVAFFTVRVYLLSILTVDTSYFKISQITESSQTVEFVQGSIYYYCMLLRGVYKLFGNHLILGVQLQIALQAMSSILMYMAIRRLAGKIVAILTLVVICLSSTSIDAGVTYSPQMLYLCMFGLVFWMCAEYLARIGKGALNWKMWIFTVLLGISVGFVCYVDVTGVLLLLLLASIFVVPCEPWKQKYVYFHLGGIVLAAVIMFLGTVFIDSIASGSSFVNVLNAWMVVYGDISFDLSLITEEQERALILLSAFASLGIFSFWRRKEEQRFVPFILMTMGMVILFFGGFTDINMDGFYLLNVLLVTLAAVSVGEMFYSPVILEEKKVELNPADIPVTVMEPELVAVYEEQEKVEMTDMEKRNKRKQEDTKMIENPLPIPKKKEKRVMDYAYQPKPFEMMYDIRVSDKDDFDI